MAEFILSAFADEASPNIPEQIAALKKAHVPCIELRNVNGKNVKDLTLDEARELRAELDAGGIKVASMGSPFGKISITDDFEPHMKEFEHALDLCHVLGTDRMRMFSFFMPKGEDPAQYRDEVIRRLDIMLDAAEREGVTLCHENEKGISGDIGDRCLDLMDQLGDRMGLVFDPANFIQCKETPAELFPKLEGWLTYMHIKDAIMETGAVVPSGCGDGGVPEIIASLAKRSGEIVLSVEPHLTVFAGLDKLQDEKLEHKFSYPDSFAAFTAATDAIKNILTDIGMKEGDGKWTL